MKKVSKSTTAQVRKDRSSLYAAIAIIILVAFVGMSAKCQTVKDTVKNELGRLYKVTPVIQLEANKNFKVNDFFKTKENGGIFLYVGDNIFNYFNEEVKNSPVKELASYEFIKDINEKDIISYVKEGNIYEELDLSHIKQICERHIVKGEKLLLEDGEVNLFWIRNKKDDLYEVYVLFDGDGWSVSARSFIASRVWSMGTRFFFQK